MKVRFVLPFIALAAMIGVSLHASSRPAVSSGSLDGHIVVDGDESDWTGSMQPFGDAPFSLQAVNDGHDLYLRLSASAPEVRREVTRFGLTVWFDPKGGSKKAFGVRYPVVEEPFDRDAGRGGGFHGGHHEPSQTPPQGGDQPDTGSEAHDRVDILGPTKNDARSLTRDHLEGVAVAMKVAQGSLVYELQVPLATDDGHPYAIGTSPGKSIGIGFETPKVNPPSMSHGGGGFGGGGFGRGGYGGHHGGGDGGRGGGGGQRGGEPPKPLKAWGTLTLHE